MIWIGGGITFYAMARKSLASGDDAEASNFLGSLESIGGPIFGVAPPATLLAGIGLVVWSNAWSFGQLWVSLALGLIVATIVLWAVLTNRSGKALRLTLEAEGALSEEFANEFARFTRFGNSDMLVLLPILALMVFKPGA